MPRAAADPKVKHLTEAELADRWGVDQVTVARLRKGGNGPAFLPLSESRTKQTIRYRLTEVEAWEAAHLKVPATA